MAGKNAAAKPLQTQKEEKQGLSDFVLEPFRGWYEYIKLNAREYYVGLLKINLSVFAVALLAYAVLFAVAVGLLAVMVGMNVIADPAGAVVKLLGNLALLAVAVVACIIMVTIAEWLCKSVSLTAVLYTDSQFEKKPFGIVEAFHKIKWPVLRFVILDWAISALIFAPAFAILAVVYGGAIAGIIAAAAGGGAGAASLGIFALLFAMMLGFALVMGYILIVSFIYGFLVQFWTYGFLLAGLGVIDALKRSVGIIRKDFWRIAAFYIFLSIAVLVASIPLTIYGFFADIVIRIITIIAGADSGLVFWAAYLIALLINVMITMVISTAVQAFRLPVHYLFWKKVKGS
ncbi:MAG: hypothetical protein QXD77_02890 [Candidatus Aenigmatarchaeota archaeon]